jgi:hypothetical protein
VLEMSVQNMDHPAAQGTAIVTFGAALFDAIPKVTMVVVLLYYLALLWQTDAVKAIRDRMAGRPPTKPLILFLTAASVAFFMPSTPKAQQSPKSAWFQSLTQPTTGRGCCSEADCATTAARVDANGTWFVPPADRIINGRWEPIPGAAWVPVPPQAILHDKQPYDGMSAYVCWVGGQVFCFVEGGAGG